MRLRSIGVIMLLLIPGAAQFVPVIHVISPPEGLSPDRVITLALNRITEKPAGVVLKNPDFKTEFSATGLVIEPGNGAPTWEYQTSSVSPVVPRFQNDRIVYDRPEITEQYLIKNNRLEQQFILNTAPETNGIKITGEINSEGEFYENAQGWRWKNEAGEVTLGHVFVFDATGREIPATMEVSATTSVISIAPEDLTTAVYPVTIDPEIGTKDFRISNTGPDGDINFSATTAAVAHCVTNDPATYPGGIYLAVWRGINSGKAEIFGQRINGETGLPIGSEFRISFSGTPDSDIAFGAANPEVTASGTEFFVVWQADDNTGSLVDNELEIYGQRINATAGTLQGSKIRISTTGTDGNAALDANVPSVTYNSTTDRYMVVWYSDHIVDEQFEVFSQGVASSGTLTGSNVRVSAMGSDPNSLYDAFNPDVSWNSTNNQYMVAWHGDNVGIGDAQIEIFVRRIDGSSLNHGNTIGATTVISDMGPAGNTAYSAVDAAISYNSTNNNYLVVWRGDDDTAPLVNDEFEVFGQFVSNFGVVANVDGFFRISNMGTSGSTNFGAFAPAIDYDPNMQRFMVSWHGDDNAGGLIDNELEIFNQKVTTSGVLDAAVIRMSDSGGSGNTTFNASNAAIIYNPSFREFLTCWQGDDNAVGGMVDNELEIWGQRYADLVTQPANQPTAPLFTTITASSLNVGFTAPIGGADGYVVLRRSGTSPTEIPADHSVYKVNNTIGASTVVHVGNATSFNQSGLTANTQYFYDVFSYNGIGSATNYNTTSPLEGNATTLFAEPTTQGTLSFTSFGTTSIQVNLNAGNGTNRLLIAKAGSAVDVFAIDGTSYTPNNNITLAPNLGSSNYVVASGSGLVTITGLSTATVYHFRIIEFNGTTTLTNYNTAAITSSTGSQTTLSTEPTAQPTAINFSAITNTSFTVGFTAATGSPTGYLIIRKSGSAPAQPADLPVDGTTYTVNAALGGSTVVQVSNAVSLAQTSLTPATEYYYLIVSYAGSGGNINYRTTTPLAGNQFTLSTEPTTQTTGIALNPTLNSLSISWTNGNGTERLIVARQDNAVSVNPSDGTAYTGNQNFSTATDLGSGNKVIYRGTGNSTTLTNLAANTTYHVRIYELNGANTTTNYLTTPASGNPASRATLLSEPATQASAISFSAITSNSVGVNFTIGNGSSRLLIARQGSAVTTPPSDGVSYTANAAFGTPASQLGSGNYIVGAGSGPFTITGLASGATYHFQVYEFNGTSGTENYNTTTSTGNPANTTTLIVEPTIQTTAIAFTAFTPNSLTLSWTNGNGAERLVIARQGSAVSIDPADGASYSGNTNFSTATDIGSGNKVIFKGSGNSVTVTNLLPNTTYHFRSYEFNGSGVSTNYLLTTASGNPANRTTLIAEPSAQPTAVTFSLQTTTSLRLNYSAAAGPPTGYLIIRKSGSASAGIPVDGTSYSVGGSLDGTIVAINNITQFDDSGLTAGTTYHYTIFSYNGAGPAINYLTTLVGTTGSTITLPAAPTAEPASTPTQTSFVANWTAVTGAANYLLDVSTDNFSTFISGYNAKSITGITEPVTGLSSGTTYQYRVRAQNSSGQSTNSSVISQITVPATPVGLAFSNPEQTTVTLTWTASTGAAEYLIDLSADNFSSFVTGYNGKVVTAATEPVTGLTAGNSYQVRIRSRNLGGTSPNSTTISQLLKPATPVAIDADPIGINSFTAKWQTSNGASSFVLDISTVNDFSTHQSGYPQNVGGAVEQLISGLGANSSFFYKVKAVNATGESPYSNVKPVQTLPDAGVNNLSIGTITFNNLEAGQNAASVSVVITGGTGTKSLHLLHRGITSTETPTERPMLNTSGDNYSVEVPASAFDELGLAFSIRASDASANPPISSTLRYSYKSFTASTAQAIPTITRFGGTQQSYQIISIPLKLENNNIAEIFEPVLGAYDKTKWRLLRYQNEKKTDYKAGISLIEQGKSYWFNSVDQVSIKPGPGTAPLNNQATPFQMVLTKGWNQIASPYPFAIDWDDVIAANNNTTMVGKYRIFSSEPLEFKDSNSLQPYSGGFVFADEAITLSIPVTLKNSAGGRKSDHSLVSNLDEEAWALPFKLVQGDAENSLGGIGMHPSASPDKDQWDDLTLPRFIQYLEPNFYHPGFFWPKFTRDIIPTQEEFQWILVIESNGKGPIIISWDAPSIVSTTSDLFLFDEQEGRLINMKVQSSYTMSENSRRELKIIYTQKGEFIPNRITMGKPWPNPSDNEVNIPFTLAQAQHAYQVEVEVFDLKGGKVMSLENEFNPGLQTLSWNGKDFMGNEVSNGMYLLKLKVNGHYLSEYAKIIINRNH